MVDCRSRHSKCKPLCRRVQIQQAAVTRPLTAVCLASVRAAALGLVDLALTSLWRDTILEVRIYAYARVFLLTPFLVAHPKHPIAAANVCHGQTDAARSVPTHASDRVSTAPKPAGC